MDTAFWITISTIMGLIILSAFFSGSETALTAASRGKLRAQADKGSRAAKRALNITEDNERLIGSVYWAIIWLIFWQHLWQRLFSRDLLAKVAWHWQLW